MFKAGNRIRHKNCIDIDLTICSVNVSTTSIALEVLYWNRHYKAYAWPMTEWVEVKHEDVKNWTIIEREHGYE